MSVKSNNIQVGDIVLLSPGRDNHPVGFNNHSKVILPTNEVELGYAKVLELLEKDTYYLCTLENVIQDFYPQISYSEFLKALAYQGYKIGFDMHFDSKTTHSKEHEILAYNLNYNTVIVATTKNNGAAFHSVEVYCPNLNGFKKYWNITAQGSINLAILDLCSPRLFEPHILEKINEKMEKIKNDKGVQWPQTESIKLYTYADLKEAQNPITQEELWNKTITRYYYASKEMDNIFKDCKKMKPILRRKKWMLPKRLLKRAHSD